MKTACRLGRIGAQIDVFAAMLTAFRQTEAGALIGGYLKSILEKPW